MVVVALCMASHALADQRVFHLNEQSEKDIGYAQAVRVSDTLYVSGSVGAGEMSAAIHQAYDELKKTLSAHGLDFSNVVKENVYTTNIDEFISNKSIRKEYYGKHTPAATWVEVRRLYSPDHVVEVELVAAFPHTRHAKNKR